MKSFFERLQCRVESVNSLLCVGLDPHPSHIKDHSLEAISEFCLNIIHETHEFAAAFKPNAAFFESRGADGVRVLTQICNTLHEMGIPIILDVKRGDIGSTASHYAKAAYDICKADAVTLSPYMGWDSIAPFVTEEYKDRGAFVLCKTSNSSSVEFQEVQLKNGMLLFEKVAQQTAAWSDSTTPYCCLGMVTGATDIKSLVQVRLLAPDAWLLCPGVGAQGGNAEDVCRAALRTDGSGLLVAVSRAISNPDVLESGKTMGDIARELRDKINSVREELRRDDIARELRDKINSVREELRLDVSGQAESTQFEKISQGNKNDDLLTYQKEFLELCITNRVLQFGSFTLKSGRLSPYFFNAGNFHGGRSMAALCRYYAQAIKLANMDFDIVFGPAYKGIPLATGVASAWYSFFGEDKEFAYNRKEPKDHGEGGSIVGSDVSGKRVLIVDDVITAGTAIRAAMETLLECGAIVVGVAVALDREEATGSASSSLIGDTVSPVSAIQQVKQEFNIDVVPIVRSYYLSNCFSLAYVFDSLSSLVQFMQSNSNGIFTPEQCEAIKEYQQNFGAMM